MKLLRLIAPLWPTIIIILAWAAIVLTNYTPGTWLTGWDNLHPEFDFFLNVKRSLFAVWQEYQGVGLLGGMGHAADLPRQLMLWTASLVLPAQLLRWAWTFSMLLAGPLGVYALVKSILINPGSRVPPSQNASDGHSNLGMTTTLPALVAAIFYLFNLATVQVFTAPFDAFVTHYGILPWLLWINWEFLHAPSRKTLLFVAIINIIGMTHAYIPTLFLVYLILLSILCISVLIRAFGKTTITRIVSLGLVTFCINAFWLLPFAHFTITKSPVTVGAKINTMATEEIYLQNKAFGDIQNVATLKSYWYDTADYNPTSGTLEPVLGYWRDLDRNNWMTWVRYGLVAFIFFGGIIALSQKQTRVWGALGIVAIGMVAVDTPPFLWMIDWLRGNVPLFSQFFRFPFTKWGIALALSYSIWLGIGVWWILDKLKAYSSKIIPVCVVLIPTSLAIIGAIGMLQGQLVSPKFKLTIPGEYFQLFTKLKTLPQGRIANLPQNTFWGWTYYRWGYSGSGFLWYGIENPIMDRAFDVWTREGEQYYWELSRAIYSKNTIAFDAVLAKYDVRYILLDESIISPSSDRGLFIGETKELLAQIPEMKNIVQIGTLTLYERTDRVSKSFVSLKSNLPTVSPAYRWTDHDVAYGELGDYIVRDNKQKTISSLDYTYPFRSLFTKRSVDPLRRSDSEASEREFTVTETPDTITIGSISEATSASILKANQTVYDSTKSAPARNASRSDAGGDLTAENVQQCGVLREGVATAKEEYEDIKPTQPPGTIPGIKLSNQINFLRFTSRNQRGCLSFSAGNLPHRDGYLIAVESRHIAGRPLLFSLINQTAKHVELETYLDESKVESLLQRRTSLWLEKSKVEEWQMDYFILPPLAPDGLGYTVYLSNDAIGKQESVNDIKSIKFYRMPYQELISMRTGNPQPQGQALSVGVDIVSHPNPAYYLAKLDPAPQGNIQPATLILSQSFDPGWTAWEKTSTFPYLRQLKDHVLVNNWANGWKLNNTRHTSKTRNTNKIEPSVATTYNLQPVTIVLFFLPQLLEWLGLAFLPIPFLFVWYTKKHDQVRYTVDH
ncbi:MAG: hypothetical protein Q8L37_05130 [Candidatus Gottesmanbacteria bacterium]|nr:hypothetical protein [Candidatus Gottesmanbacteria bacterium]